MKEMAQGRGIPRSIQILRTRRSWISVCLGIALRLLRSGWCHQEWLPPSRSRLQPCRLSWRNSSLRFTGRVRIPHRSHQRLHAPLNDSFRALRAEPLAEMPIGLHDWTPVHSHQEPLPPSQSTNCHLVSQPRCRCSQRPTHPNQQTFAQAIPPRTTFDSIVRQFPMRGEVFG